MKQIELMQIYRADTGR